MVEVFDIGLDSIATCHHPSAINLITLSIFSLSHGLKILHSRLESKLGLLHISPSELSLLELLVNLVCLLVLEVEEIFIDEHGIKSRPARLDRVVLDHIVEVLNLQVIFAASLKLDEKSLLFIVLLTIF